MNKTLLNIIVQDSVARLAPAQPLLICGNDKYRIRFTFDEEWADHPDKVVRFLSKGEFHDVEFKGDEVDVPVQVNTFELKVGVYTDDGPFTTTSAVIPCKPSILCEDVEPSIENDKRYLNEAREVVKAVYERFTIKKEVRGSPLVLSDVSPLTHELKVQMRSRNRLDLSRYENWPYASLEKNGVTFTWNADGSVTLNGTATAYTKYSLAYQVSPLSLISPGKNYIRAFGADSGVRMWLDIYANGYPRDGLVDATGTGAWLNLTEDFVKSVYQVDAYLEVVQGRKVDNLTIYPVLTQDGIPTEYAPYVGDFTGVTLKRYGATEEDLLETYKADAEGVVQGVASLYPVTTLATDYSVILEAEYNILLQAGLDEKADKTDVDERFANLQAQIDALKKQ